MACWYPDISTRGGATSASKMGIYGALGMAVWFGIPLLYLGPRMRDGLISPVEIALMAVIVGLALLGAWRFHKRGGSIIGPILMVVLVVEVAKRLYLNLMFDSLVRINPVSWIAAAMIFAGLLSGIRGARALRHLSPENDLHEVFE